MSGLFFLFKHKIKEKRNRKYQFTNLNLIYATKKLKKKSVYFLN